MSMTQIDVEKFSLGKVSTKQTQVKNFFQAGEVQEGWQWEVVKWISGPAQGFGTGQLPGLWSFQMEGGYPKIMQLPWHFKMFINIL